MFSVPGFSIGSLVVESPKEQLKKRRLEEKIAAEHGLPTPASGTTNNNDDDFSGLTSGNNSTSTSNAPFSKKFKKDPSTEKKAPAEPQLGWGWIPEPVPLKDRESWNRSTKALKKAKAAEERDRKGRQKAERDEEAAAAMNAISDPSKAIEMLLSGSVDISELAALENKPKGERKFNPSLFTPTTVSATTGTTPAATAAGSTTTKPATANKDIDGDVVMGEGQLAKKKKLTKRERQARKEAYIAADAAAAAATSSIPTNEAESMTVPVALTSSQLEKKAVSAPKTKVVTLTPVNAGVTEEAAPTSIDAVAATPAALERKPLHPKIPKTPKPLPEPKSEAEKEETRRLKKERRDKVRQEKRALLAGDVPTAPETVAVESQSTATVAAVEHLNPSSKRIIGQSSTDQSTLAALQAATAQSDAALGLIAQPEVEMPAPRQKEVAGSDSKKPESAKDKKKKQLSNKEKEKLQSALSRTNSALEALQKALGDEDMPLSKEAVKATVPAVKSTITPAESSKMDKKKNMVAAAVAAKAAAAPAPPVKLTKLQEQMKKKLAGGKFRFLNEQLYTTTGEEAFTLFQAKPELFDEYHEGFRSQVELWPTNPVDIFINYLKKLPTTTVIADLGCGDAQIARDLPKHKNVLSFDLVAKNDRVQACDIAHLPLKDNSVDIAIFCLSLMGTDFLRFLKEAHRVLKPKGELKISEVISRFTDVDSFVAALKSIGFELVNSDASNKMFIMFDFIKPDPAIAIANTQKTKKGKKGGKKSEPAEEAISIDDLDGSELLKPCIYKKR